VGKNRVKKSLILGMDSGKTPLFSVFNVDSYGKLALNQFWHGALWEINYPCLRC